MQNLEKVRVGQTTEQVRSAIGKPEAQKAEGAQEIWDYDIYSEDGRTIYPYRARFEKGVLVSITPDSLRNKEARLLKEDRSSSKQFIFKHTTKESDPNPPLIGTPEHTNQDY